MVPIRKNCKKIQWTVDLQIGKAFFFALSFTLSKYIWKKLHEVFLWRKKICRQEKENKLAVFLPSVNNFDMYLAIFSSHFENGNMYIIFYMMVSFSALKQKHSSYLLTQSTLDTKDKISPYYSVLFFLFPLAVNHEHFREKYRASSYWAVALASHLTCILYFSMTR